MKTKKTMLAILLVCNFAQADNPLETAQKNFDRAIKYKQNKNSEKAIKYYQKTLALNPLHFKAHFNLACEYYYLGLNDHAITHYRKAIRINPESASSLFNLGTLLSYKADQKQEAYAYFTKAIAINPNYTQAYFLRGKLLESLGNIDAAVANYLQAISIQDDHIDSLTAVAKILRDREECNEAIDILIKANKIQPKNINILFDLALVANKIGKTKLALETYNKILEIIPNHAQTYYNIGYTLKMENNPALAITMYKRALELNPNYKDARFAIGLAYLNNGQFEQGWAWHENYLKDQGINGEKLRVWLSEGTVAGKRLLLRQQGGFGDTMQFVRYLQKLKELGAYTIVVTRKQMKPLLSNCDFIDEIITIGEPFPAYDDVTTLMALPAIFNSTQETIPKNIPYLFANSELVNLWRKKLSSEKTIFKIGLCWISDRNNDKSRPPVARRSIPLNLLAPLANIENVKFYNLQKISDPQEFATCPEKLSIETFGPDFDTTNGPFMDTAALIQNLDLVISVDTSIAHLAGGLGVPVWLMLPYSVDWRWIANKTYSPWYPAMRIFKQKTPLDWVPIVQEMATALNKLINIDE